MSATRGILGTGSGPPTATAGRPTPIPPRSSWAAHPPRPSGADPWAANRAGRALAMSFFTPLRHGGALALRLRLALYRYGLGIFGRRVASLSFLHSARWSVVRRLPGDHGRGPSRLLFQSNYNGPWHTYIETFSALVGGGIGRILHTSVGFPGVTPVADFKEYLEGHEHVLGHYWSAYQDRPDASATVITAALDLDRRLDRFARRARRLSDADLADALPRFLTTVQHTLGGGAPRRAPRRPPWSAPRQTTVTALVPVDPRRAGAISGYLAALASGPSSPLAAVGGVHLARLAVIDWAQDGDRPGPVTPLVPPRLLLTADVQGRPRQALRRLVAGLGSTADELWGTCPGWPGSVDPARCAGYLGRYRVPVHLAFTAYPRHTVAEVRAALDRRHRLLAAVATAGGRPAPSQVGPFREVLTRPVPEGG